MMEITIGSLTIDISGIITFFSGVIFGFIILALWYLVAVIASLNKSKKIKKVDEADIDQKEIEWLIDDAHTQFKNKKLRDEVGFGRHLLNVSLDLSKDIAQKFYPNSKYPYLELTIDEAILLLSYVSKRFDELLEKPILKMFKGMTLRRIMTLNDAKLKIDNNLIVKKANQYKLTKWYKNTMMVLNVVNPVYWFRRLIVNNVMGIILEKLGLVVISLTGEETYKVYSKKVFNQDVEIDSGIEDLYNEIESELKEDKS
ncbi:hypothetical protein [Acholeplasma equifetale]|uniref:hypothetical protein n=1 Tax=Acholeplasma equifetale TaxID=264634 RepID=UPI00138B089C|nr:hypothetical protein [Acholeplasma equifetale]